MLARKKFLAIFMASAFGLFLTGCFSRAGLIEIISKNSASSTGAAGSGSGTSESANTSKQAAQSSDTAKKSAEESAKTSFDIELNSEGIDYINNIAGEIKNN